jgi:asparagine synthase (glutamine-hydrolysing)
MKQDQMSMAASIESRVPFLDHEFAGWVARQPDRVKLRGLTTKWVLREAMRGKLPAEILSRKKMGFPVPVGAWFRGRWAWMADEFVLGSRAIDRGMFDVDYVRQIVLEHRAGLNHSERLWALTTFEMWCRIFLDRESAEDVGRQIKRAA